MTAPSLAALRDTRVLILGASGFIGRWLARLALEAGAHVTAVGRDQSAVRAALGRAGREAPHLTVQAADVTNDGVVTALLQDAAAALVINAVGYGIDRTERDERRTWTLNAEFPAQLVRIMETMPGTRTDWNGTRLLHVGSGAEYGDLETMLAESVDATPTSAYGRAKLAGTQQVLTAPFAACVTRLFNVYGPGEQDGRLLPTLLAARHHDQRVPLTAGRQRRDFTYVSDAALAVLALACQEARTPRVVNVATGALYTVRDFAERAAQQLGVAAHRLDFGAVAVRGLETSYAGVAVDRLREALGWTPSSDLGRGIQRTIEIVDDSAPDCLMP